MPRVSFRRHSGKTVEFNGITAEVYGRARHAITGKRLEPGERHYHVVYVVDGTARSSYVVAHWAPGDRGGDRRCWSWYETRADLMNSDVKNWTLDGLKACLWENVRP